MTDIVSKIYTENDIKYIFSMQMLGIVLFKNKLSFQLMLHVLFFYWGFSKYPILFSSEQVKFIPYCILKIHVCHKIL